MAVEAQTMGALNQILKYHPRAKIILTGHSLGAALATFAAVHLRLEAKIPAEDITFYTFGSPRTGNQAWADFFYSLYPAGQTQRVVHYNDIVPHLPQSTFGFTHIGDEVWFNKNSNTDVTYVICENHPGVKEDMGCSSSIFFNGVEEHLHYMGKAMHEMCIHP